MAAATLCPQMTAATEHNQKLEKEWLKSSNRVRYEGDTLDRLAQQGPGAYSGAGGAKPAESKDEGYPSSPSAMQLQVLEGETSPEAKSSLEAEAEAERKMLEAEAAMGEFRLAHEAIGQLASSPAGRDYLRRREANSVPTTASVEEESKDEDEEDEDNGLAQSLAVTTQASSSARRSNQF